MVACLRANCSADDLFQAAKAAVEGGLGAVEVTLTSPHAFEVIARLRAAFPAVLLGAGTVMTYDDAQRACAAGAQLLTSPVMDESLVKRFAGDGPEARRVLFLPGIMTPTEAQRAVTAGAHLVKLFPAPAAGGVGFVRALRGAMPHVGVVPSHGVTLGLAGHYLRAGAPAVILSGAVFPKHALAARDWGAIRSAAAAAAELVKSLTCPSSLR